jgi:preprotein translocase subunit YajC
VKSLVPFIIFLIVVIGLIAFSARARRRQAAAAAERAEHIAVGSEVMTTSGLYGTVVARNDDETVMMSVAPGVEVKWALAALRDVESLPAQYRQSADGPDDPGELDTPVNLDKPRGRSSEDGGADPAS